MRTLNYNFDGREVTVTVCTESGDHICDVKFPSIGASKSLYEQDVNWHFSNCSQSSLTEEEKTYLKNLVDSQN